jgi:hypothetical protein
LDARRAVTSSTRSPGRTEVTYTLVAATCWIVDAKSQSHAPGFARHDQLNRDVVALHDLLGGMTRHLDPPEHPARKE